MNTKRRIQRRWLIAIYLVALLTICVTLPVGFKPSYAAGDESLLVSTATRAGRLAVFDDVWETIYERYYDPSLRGVNWEGSRVVFRPAAAEAKTTHDFYELLRRMIAPLRDAHTRVFSPEEKFDWWNPRFITVGLTVREVQGDPIIVNVEPKSAAADAGVRVGDIVVAVDNVTPNEFIAGRTHDSALSTTVRLRAMRSMFEGVAGTSLTVAWKNKHGRVKSVVLQRYWSQRTLGFRFRQQDEIAIITLDAFTKTIASDFLKQLPTMTKDVRGIILDLRGNGGGDAEAMADIASGFLQTGINLGKFADRSGASFELITTPFLPKVSSFTAPTALPMVVLTSESTSSAAEILASTLQQRRRAWVIGTPTCGCVLAIRNRHALPDGGVLDVSEFDYRTAEGVRLEGAGITPNEVTNATRSDLYARRDVAGDHAKRYLAGLIH